MSAFSRTPSARSGGLLVPSESRARARRMPRTGGPELTERVGRACRRAAGQRAGRCRDVGSVRAMTTDVPEILADLVARPAWAVIRLKDADEVLLVGGTPSQVESLLDVPLEEGVPAAGRHVDRLLAVPFRQVAERGFEAHDDGAPLTVVDVDLELRLPARRRARGAADRRGLLRGPGRLRDLRRGVRRRSCAGSSTTRSATARAPTSSWAVTTAPSSPTGVPRRRWRCCATSSSTSGGRTGRSCSSPGSATWWAPAPSATSRSTAATSG